MQQEIKENPVLSAVDIIFTKGQKSKFTESFQQSVSKEAQIICEYLGMLGHALWNGYTSEFCFGYRQLQ
jgi:hypothetical protein